MDLTDKELNEIADNLDAGLRCYFHLKTREIKTIINFDTWLDADKEAWSDIIKEIEEHPLDYYEFEGMNSRDSFRLMVDFIDLVDDNKLRDSLIRALNRSKPFSNFKWQIDNSGPYRQKWFDFKKSRYIDWVKDQLDDLNRSHD